MIRVLIGRSCNGVSVRLTEQRSRYAVGQHSETDGLYEEMLKTLAGPDTDRIRTGYKGKGAFGGLLTLEP